MSMIDEMRSWLLDLDWADDDAEEMIATAPDAAIKKAVNASY